MKRLQCNRDSVLALSFVLALAMVAAPLAQAQSPSQVNAQIGQAYAAVLGAEKSGGNVTSLVAKLDSATSLLQQANLVNSTDPARARSLYSQASSLAGEVLRSAPAVAAAGEASVSATQLALGVESAVLTALALLAYLYTPRAYWTLWLRTHKDWKVRKS